MLRIFSNMVERIMEVHKDNLPIYGDGFEDSLTNLERVLKICKEKKMVLI